MRVTFSPSYSSGTSDYLTGADRRIEYMPSPDVIAKACTSIQMKWTLSERQRRFVGKYASPELEAIWTPPVIGTSHFRFIATDTDIQ